jgi:hypothetical protein
LPSSAHPGKKPKTLEKNVAMRCCCCRRRRFEEERKLLRSTRNLVDGLRVLEVHHKKIEVKLHPIAAVAGGCKRRKVESNSLIAFRAKY